MLLKVWLLGAFVLAVNYGVSFAQHSHFDCPTAEYISPCVCYIPNFYLVCSNIEDVDSLRTVAENLEGVINRFAIFWIMNSTLQYLPKELLEIVKVRELHIENVVLHSLFREPPTSLKMFEIIRLQNVKVLRGIVWKVFSQMTNLKTITIDGLSESSLGRDFSENVPHKLRELEFLNSKTKKLEIGVFENFKDLVKVEMYKCKINELHRGSFPVPFNVEKMYFPFNNLKSIPDDLFTDMPNLDDVILVSNHLSTIPESAFGGRFNHLGRLLLQGNPIKCNCALRWIVIHKPEFFDGTCVAPKVMNGRELNDLNYGNFHCDDDSTLG